jgi:hypothetical protein
MVLWNAMPNSMAVRCQSTALHGVESNGTKTIISVLNAGCVKAKLQFPTVRRTITAHYKRTAFHRNCISNLIKETMSDFKNIISEGTMAEALEIFYQNFYLSI